MDNRGNRRRTRARATDFSYTDRRRLLLRRFRPQNRRRRQMPQTRELSCVSGQNATETTAHGWFSIGKSENIFGNMTDDDYFDCNCPGRTRGGRKRIGTWGVISVLFPQAIESSRQIGRRFIRRFFLALHLCSNLLELFVPNGPYLVRST